MHPPPLWIDDKCLCIPTANALLSRLLEKAVRNAATHLLGKAAPNATTWLRCASRCRAEVRFASGCREGSTYL
jgi:hypothetical protein